MEGNIRRAGGNRANFRVAPASTFRPAGPADFTCRSRIALHDSNSLRVGLDRSGTYVRPESSRSKGLVSYVGITTPSFLSEVMQVLRADPTCENVPLLLCAKLTTLLSFP